MKNQIVLIAASLFLTASLTTSCQKKDSPEPSQKTPTTTTTTNTTTPTYSTATYNLALLEVSTTNQTPQPFGSNRKIIIIADGVAIDSLLTPLPVQQHYVYYIVDTTNYCTHLPNNINLTSHTFKIQTNATNLSLNYFEGNTKKSQFFMNSSGVITSYYIIPGTGVTPYSGGCSNLAIFKK